MYRSLRKNGNFIFGSTDGAIEFNKDMILPRDYKFKMVFSDLRVFYPQRRELFENQKKTVEKEIERLQKTLDMLRFKCWYYDTAIADGNEDRINEMLPNNLPEDIQKLYDHAHSDDED